MTTGDRVLVYHYRANGQPAVKEGLAVITKQELKEILTNSKQNTGIPESRTFADQVQNQTSKLASKRFLVVPLPSRFTKEIFSHQRRSSRTSSTQTSTRT